MDFTTNGKEIHKGRIVPLFIDDENIIFENHKSTFRLLVVESGSVLLELNNNMVFVESPAIFCINNRDILTIKKEASLDIKTIYFKPEIINSRFGENFLTEEEISELSFTESQDHRWLNPFYFDNEEISRYVKLGPSSLKKLLTSCESLSRELSTQPDGFWPCRSRSIFLEILFSIHNMQRTYDSFKNTISGDTGFLENIMLFLHTNYMEDISLTMLVEKFSINRTKINDMFINTTGKSVIKYLIDLRIKLACLILRDTLRPIKEVAYQTGFKDTTHFGRTFKKVIELNPTQYREEYNWMIN